MKAQSSATTDDPDRDQRHQIVEGLSDDVIQLEPDGRIVWANAAALAMHGCEKLADLDAKIADYQRLFDLSLCDGKPLPPAAKAAAPRPNNCSQL